MAAGRTSFREPPRLKGLANKVLRRERAVWAAEKLARTATPYELRLQAKLRAWGFWFRDQWIVECAAKTFVGDLMVRHGGRSIIVEVDGGYHFQNRAQLHLDNLRDWNMRQQGYGILRIRNEKVEALTREDFESQLSRVEVRYDAAERLSPRRGTRVLNRCPLCVDSRPCTATTRRSRRRCYKSGSHLGRRCWHGFAVCLCVPEGPRLREFATATGSRSFTKREPSPSPAQPTGKTPTMVGSARSQAHGPVARLGST